MLPHDIRDVVKPIYRPVGSNQVYELYIDTNVPVDDQFSSPKQIRWSAALGKLLVGNGSSSFYVQIRNSNLSFFAKQTANNMTWAQYAIDSDRNNYFTHASGYILKYTLNFIYISSTSVINSIRMIDASGDPDYVYVSSNNGTDHHGFRQVKKSTMAVTASALADGAGDGQFDDPLGIFYYNSEVFVADYDNSRISVWTKAGETLTYARKYDLGYKPMDLAFDGTNWFVQSATTTYKYDATFTDATKVSTACVGYSLTIIPDQGDGYGATLAISNNSGSCLYRRKCSDLSLIATVGSAGDGSSSLFDPVITGPAGTWTDSEGNQYSVASGANISKNGFSGDFFRGAPNRMIYRVAGGNNLASITALDFNADAIQGEVRNLYKCINLTSLKLQTNPALVLDLGRLSAKLTTLWAYACGSGISGSIRHMTLLTSVNLRENGASQAQVDQWIDDLYANKDIMAPGTANFNGTNSAPSAGAKAQADELVANYSWSITYTL
jgi:hypothetical protein